MDHHEVRFRLDDYVEETLPEVTRREMDEHLAGCPACAKEVERAKLLVTRTRELPRRLEPRRDLWPGIQTRLARPSPAEAKGGSWFEGLRGALAAAAAVAVLLTGSWLVAERVGNRDAVRETGNEPSAQALPSELTRTLWALEAETASAGRSLMAAMEGGPSTTREGLEAINRGLNVLSLAIAESQAALREDPQNQQLLRRLTRYYQQRVQLLQQATQLATRT